MEEAQEKLLKKSLLILPDEINHDAYQYVLEATLRRKKQILMFCRGDGGCARSALAIVDAIQQHGDVIGLLAGEADSSHVTVWAGCSQRYVYPYGMIGVHKASFWEVDGRNDSHNMRLYVSELENTENQVAQVLASASDKTKKWWLKVINRTGSNGIRQFNAVELIDMGMASPISQFTFPDIEDS